MEIVGKHRKIIGKKHGRNREINKEKIVK